jgi:hypothetical protein
MNTHRSTLFSISVACSSLILLASCRPAQVDPYSSQSGLVANGDYRATSVQYDKPFRIFTHDGEVVNQTVISTYIDLHPDLQQIAFSPDTASPLQIIASQSHTVYHNGKSFYASVTDGTFEMRQTDTSISGSTNPGRNIDLLFASQQSYDSLRLEVLEMNNSYSRLERTAFDSYRDYQSDHYIGSFANGEVSIPFTFFATTMWADSHLFAVKPNPQPHVAPGDTVLVREGKVVFRKR